MSTVTREAVTPRLAVSRGDIVWVDFGPATGSTKAGRHPALVVQNDVGNRVSPITIVVPLTDERQFKNLPVQVLLNESETGLGNKPSCVECGHVMAIDRERSIDRGLGVVGQVAAGSMERVNAALRISLGLP